MERQEITQTDGVVKGEPLKPNSSFESKAARSETAPKLIQLTIGTRNQTTAVTAYSNPKNLPEKQKFGNQAFLSDEVRKTEKLFPNFCRVNFSERKRGRKKQLPTKF